LTTSTLDLESIGVKVIRGTGVSHMLMVADEEAFDVVIEFLWYSNEYMAYLWALVRRVHIILLYCNLINLYRRMRN
jgi:hypothetical protein